MSQSSILNDNQEFFLNIKGDSGGSLMKLVNNRWTIMGVVSNGDISCGGTGIYINVPYFYDWITANSQD